MLQTKTPHTFVSSASELSSAGGMLPPSAVAPLPQARAPHTFMSSMSELRGGLSEEQRRHAETLRQQLQRDLQEQASDWRHLAWL